MKVARILNGMVVNIEEGDPVPGVLVPAGDDEVRIGMDWSEGRGFHVRDPLEPSPESIGVDER